MNQTRRQQTIKCPAFHQYEISRRSRNWFEILEWNLTQFTFEKSIRSGLHSRFQHAIIVLAEISTVNGYVEISSLTQLWEERKNNTFPRVKKFANFLTHSLSKNLFYCYISAFFRNRINLFFQMCMKWTLNRSILINRLKVYARTQSSLNKNRNLEDKKELKD